MNVLGIDPGLDGAYAMLSEERRAEVVRDTPTEAVTTTTGTRRHYRLDLIIEALRRFQLDYGAFAVAGLENVHAMPGQGVRSMFTMGQGLGLWRGLLAGLDIPVVLVTPQAWKKAYALLGEDKDASRARAIAQFPHLAGKLERKKDHGRAEALLIAEYTRRIKWKGAR